MSTPSPSTDTRFKPGQSGNPSGRPRSRLDRVDQVLEAAGKHPVKELLKLIPELKPKEQVEMWLQLWSYCQAKPAPEKEPELTLADLNRELASRLTDKELFAKAEEMLKDLKKAA